MDVKIRKVMPKDLEQVFHLFNDKELCELADIKHHKSVSELMTGELAKYINHHTQASYEYRLHAIEFEGVLTGTIREKIDQDSNRIKEFGIVLGRNFWYRKIGLHTVNLMIESWQREGVKKVCCDVLQLNRSGNNLLKKVGMREVAKYEESNNVYVRYELTLS